MRNALFSCLAIFLLAIVLIPAKASAHGIEDHKLAESASFSSTNAALDKAEPTVAKAAPVQKSEKKSCNGQCCSNAACCAAIVSNHNASRLEILRPRVSIMTLSGLAPLGPPYPLFRPPRQIV